MAKVAKLSETIHMQGRDQYFKLNSAYQVSFIHTARCDFMATDRWSEYYFYGGVRTTASLTGTGWWRKQHISIRGGRQKDAKGGLVRWITPCVTLTPTYLSSLADRAPLSWKGSIHPSIPDGCSLFQLDNGAGTVWGAATSLRRRLGLWSPDGASEIGFLLHMNNKWMNDYPSFSHMSSC